MAASVVPGLDVEPRLANRWLQLCSGIVAIMAIVNLQYAWTLFTNPLAISLHTTLAAVQVAFAALILAETWLRPIAGSSLDGFGLDVMIALQNRSRIDSKGGKRHG
jgi:OFA family oxalate/formate antiporter-like MFS transporter